MRTTVTLDPDTEQLVRDLMARDDIGFKEAINRAIREGLAPAGRGEFKQRTFAMGFRPDIPYDKALALAGAVEDHTVEHEISEAP